MSFSWGGTFNKSQFDRFVAFARAQVPLIDGRVLHLETELRRLGVFTMKFDKGVPIGFSPTPAESYLGKLTAAYEVMGGDPFYDLQIRTITDPVALIKGSETKSATMYNNGEPKGAPGLADAESGNLMSRARGWLDDTLSHNRDKLEHKIRRVVDYGDQLNAEIEALKLIRQGVSVDGSLENTISEIQQLFVDGLYRAIYDDKGKDPYGKLTHAPFTSYNPGGGKPSSDGPERGEDGAFEPGETK
jgi:hypothetical protein